MGGHCRALGGAFELALAKPLPGPPPTGPGSLPPGCLYQPKWDGYRACAVVEGGKAALWSRNGADLAPRFPELADALAAQVPDGCAVDGEIVAWGGDALDFDLLQRRTGAGAALARRLSAEAPASFVAFDVLALIGKDVRSLPARHRWALLAQLAEGLDPPLQATPATTDREQAWEWWDDLAPAGLEGLVGKPLGGAYRGGQRDWWKAKRRDDVDAVCAAVIGSRTRPRQLVLGLPDPSTGRLRVAGRSAPLGQAQAKAAALFLRPPAGEHPWPEEIPVTWLDRFSKERGPVRLTLVEPVVVEVSADAARSNGAFRHTVRLVRFREDIDPGAVAPA